MHSAMKMCAVSLKIKLNNAMLSMEKKTVHQLVDYNENVIDKFFAKKERIRKFFHKHLTTSKINSGPQSLKDAGSGKFIHKICDSVIG